MKKSPSKKLIPLYILIIILILIGSTFNAYAAPHPAPTPTPPPEIDIELEVGSTTGIMGWAIIISLTILIPLIWNRIPTLLKKK